MYQTERAVFVLTEGVDSMISITVRCSTCGAESTILVRGDMPIDQLCDMVNLYECALHRTVSDEDMLKLELDGLT